jgi:phosphatidate cytidylyltransferase
VSNFWKRVLSGGIFVAAVVATIFACAPCFYLLFLFFIIVGIAEYGQMARRIDARVPIVLCASCGALLFTAGFFHNYAGERYVDLYLLLLLPLSLLPVVELYRQRGVGLRNVAFSFHAIFYIALPFTLLTYLPYRVAGEWTPSIVFLPFLLAWTNDTFAYLSGVCLGRHKLFPRVSPHKSWEGLIGGSVATLAVGAWVSPRVEGLTRADTLVIACLVVLFAVYGDLIESLFKRGVNVKDSGNLLPGHGGILDRLDALLFALPAIFVYLEWKY